MTERPRPRVVHLTSVHPRDDTRIFVKQCRSLAAAGYEVHLVAPGDRDETIDGVHVHAVPQPSGGRLQRMTGTVFAVYRIARLLDGDVYHCHDPELWPVAVLLRRRDRPTVFDSHEHLPEQILTKHWIPATVRRPLALVVDAGERLAARFVSAVVTVEPYVRDRFARTARRTLTVGNYPMLQELASPNGDWSARDRAVLYAGSLTEIRAARELVEAIGLTADARLLIAGHFSPASLEQELAQRPGWRQVDFRGRLSRPELVELMSRARAGLVVFRAAPHHDKANPTKMFEYMLAGLPVIASDFPAWREFVERHECGVCVDANSPESIAEGIRWILDNPEEALAMGQNGRRTVEELYTWEAEEEKLLGLYQDLVGPGRP